MNTMLNEIRSFKNYLTQMINMDEESFDSSIKYLQIVKIPKNGFLVREGQICNKIAFIDQGLFRIYYFKDGIEINTCFCREHSITSSFNSLINRVPSTESIQALEDSVIVTITAVDLALLEEENTTWQTARRILTEKECLRLSDRASFLSFESAFQKYETLLKYQPDLIKRVPVQHIASYIGVSRETLSRIRSRIS